VTIMIVLKNNIIPVKPYDAMAWNFFRYI
jgi:hypothetical protein